MVRKGARDAVDLGRLDQPRPSRIDVKRRVADPRLVPDEQSMALAKRIEKSRLPVVLRLPAAEGLIALDDLPAAAERHLRDVVGHRVDMLTPWTSDQVAFDARVHARSKDSGRIKVEATFAPRETIEDANGILATFNIRPTIVDVAGARLDDLPRVDLLQGVGARTSKWMLIPLVCLAIAVPLVSAGLFFDFWQRSFLVAERHEQEGRLASRAAEANAAQAQRHQAIADARFLDARRLERPSSLAALEIVSNDLPDDVWLSRFELAGDKVTLTGEAPEAPRVLAVIGADPRFAKAALGNSSTRGPSVAPELFGKPVDRFTLTASLAPAAKITPAPPPSPAVTDVPANGAPLTENPAASGMEGAP